MSLRRLILRLLFPRFCSCPRPGYTMDNGSCSKCGGAK